jgi:7-cyano-7-deazaguanine synthase in queuosine biosynthesis
MSHRIVREHVVLYSGGPDSLITYMWVLDNVGDENIVKPIYIPLGHKYEMQERKAVDATIGATKVFGLRDLGRATEKPNAEIPNRNAYLCLAALSEVSQEPATIWLTVQDDEMNIPDRSLKFMRGMGDLFRSLDRGVSVETPWSCHDKASMFRWYVGSGHDVELLKKTYSCYEGGVKPCWNCAACIRRYIAFSSVGVMEEGTDDIRDSRMAKVYLKRAKEGYYSSRRNSRILEALG